MKETDKILTRVFAKTAAIWLPIVVWQRPNPRNVWFARQRYRGNGIRWTSGKSDNADQQRTGRALAALPNVSVTRAGGRTVYVKPTLAGLHRAAALCGVSALGVTIDMMRRLAELEIHPKALGEPYSGFVSEDLLLGWLDEASGPKTREAWLGGVDGLAERLLLALICEWVEGISDGGGKVYYRLLPAGRAILDNPPKPPRRLPKPTIEARELFFDTVEQARGEIATADETPRGELGYCPISCSPTTRGMEVRQS